MRCSLLPSARRAPRWRSCTAGARSLAPAAAWTAGAAEAADDPEAEAVQRPAGVDRRAARGAGRAGQPGRAQRHGRTIRRANTASRALPPPCSKKAPARGRRSRSRMPSTTSAPISAPRRRRTCRRCGCTCRSRASPTRCRSWPTSRCGRRSRKTSSIGSASSGSPACSRDATTRRPFRRSPSRAFCTARATATARRRWARPKRSRR